MVALDTIFEKINTDLKIDGYVLWTYNNVDLQGNATKTTIYLKDMTRTHIINSRNRLMKKPQTDWTKKWIADFNNELKRRF
jgi:GH43 family beta-xylosidase